MIMPHDQIFVPLTKEQAYALVDAVMERDDLALSASAQETTEGEWLFEATCDSPPNIDAFNALVKEVLNGKVEFAIERIDPEIDWVAKSLEGLQPVKAGGFYIYGSHETAPSPAGLTPILIDAAQAFGTGHHDTTTGCLEVIDRVLKRQSPMRMLDVGTGTGVLAIALAKRSRRTVIASDIDPIAVTTTYNNARLNEVAGFIDPVRAIGLENMDIKRGGPYDLIVANILAGPLRALAPSVCRVAAPGASIVLSGILTHQAARVLAAYRQQGVVLKERLIRGEWATLLLEKPRIYRRQWCRF